MTYVRKTRDCPACGLRKPLTDFPLRGKSHSGASRYGYCKPCHSTYQRANKYERVFNITVTEYEEMLADQQGLCAICDRPPKTLRLAVDHDHKTGLIRGLLCSTCNQTIARFLDDPERFRAAASYLEKPPALRTLGARYGRKGRTTKRTTKRQTKR